MMSWVRGIGSVVLALLASCGEGSRLPAEPTKRTAMTEDRFWELIEESRTRAKAMPRKKGQDFAALQEAALEAVLQPLSPEDLAAFDRHYAAAGHRAYRWDLWAAVYWIRGGCGDSSFDNFRSVVVGLGRAAYTKILSDAEALADVVGLPDTPDLAAEGLSYVAARVYELKTGRQPPDDPAYRRPADPDRKEFDFDFDDKALMRRRLPKLTSKIPMGK